MCTYVYIHIYLDVYTYIHVCIYIFVYIYTCVPGSPLDLSVGQTINLSRPSQNPNFEWPYGSHDDFAFIRLVTMAKKLRSG